jgi:hypothetical protein
MKSPHAVLSGSKGKTDGSHSRVARLFSTVIIRELNEERRSVIAGSSFGVDVATFLANDAILGQ